MNTPSPMVSIIVPVYNGEATLRRCVDSVLNQDYRDFELLLVNDGSTDGSGAICREYAARDSRVRLIEKANSGVSDSRNRALDAARGAYLQFLDCDDWITPDATRSLVDAARGQDCHLVVADFYRVVGKRVSHKGDIEDEGVLTREEYAAHMMENPADFYYGVLWNKLYRRDIVEAHHLRMDPEVHWCEDFLFNLEYIRHAERFYALQLPIYYYVKTKGSLVTQGASLSKTVRMKLMVFEYYQQFYKSVLDEDEYDKSRLKVYRFLVDAAGDGLVPPTLLPGSRRLGEERVQVCPAALKGESRLQDDFLERKLLDRCLETAALKNNLSLSEARVLLALQTLDAPLTRQELADFTGLSRPGLTLLLQRLSARDLLRLEDQREPEDEEKRSRPVFLPAAEPVLADLEAAQARCEEARLRGFDEAERAEFARLRRRVRENLRQALE